MKKSVILFACLAMLVTVKAFALTGGKVIALGSLGNASELTTPGSTQLYPLGTEVVVQDVTNNASIQKYVYVKAGAALTAYNVYQVVVSTYLGDVTTQSPTNVNQTLMPVVAPVAFTSGQYGFVQYYGIATAAMTASTTIGNTARVIASGTTLSDTGGVTLSSCTAAQVWQTLGSAGNGKVFLYGRNGYAF